MTPSNTATTSAAGPRAEGAASLGRGAAKSVDLDQLCINTIRTLAIDAVEQAHSGHPGAPMALAPTVFCLWQRFLRFDPDHPIWPNRDRFVLSAGHASMLVYALLHLAGVKAVNQKYDVLGELSVTLDDIKRFRQLDSKCPGHPEYRWTSGVETTTGPLGQGVATSVGMAIAGRWEAAHFNRPSYDMFDYDVFALCGDGCLMEGISHEAASLAGYLKLSNLCWIYDNNHITIEGPTRLTCSDDIASRFMSYGWNVTRVGDGNDLEMLDRAFTTFKLTQDRPTLIVVDTHIGYGSPHKQDTSAAHGEPLGEEEVRLTKRAYGWPEDAKFLIPDDVREHFQNGLGVRGRALHEAWWTKFEEYRRQYPSLAEDGYRMLRRELPDGWDADLPEFPADPKGLATREASSAALNAIGKRVSWLLGGSADLAPSCKTRLTFEGAADFNAENHAGRNLHFGIREHAMGAILNGLALSKIRPFGSGFLIFSDYERTALRLSALMEIPVLHIFTHDSIGVGEDGPTHQPVEQLASLRAIPGLITLRPADANEVVEAWRQIMAFRHEPVALILTRQAVPTLDRAKYRSAEGVRRGAYIVADAVDGKPDVLLLATGSEVGLCIDAGEQLKTEGINARVVSMPSWEMFEYYCRQHPEYRDQVLPSEVTARVSVEQASTFGWERYIGSTGHAIGMETFGASSAPQGTAAQVRVHAGVDRGGGKSAAHPITSDHAGPLRRRAVRHGRRDHRYGQRPRHVLEGDVRRVSGEVVQAAWSGVSSVRVGDRLQTVRRWQAAISRRPRFPHLPRHRSARGHAGGFAGHGNGLRPGQSEKRVSDEASRRRRQGVSGFDCAFEVRAGTRYQNRRGDLEPKLRDRPANSRRDGSVRCARGRQRHRRSRSCRETSARLVSQGSGDAQREAGPRDRDRGCAVGRPGWCARPLWPRHRSGPNGQPCGFKSAWGQPGGPGSRRIAVANRSETSLHYSSRCRLLQGFR
jgi:transketolase